MDYIPNYAWIPINPEIIFLTLPVPAWVLAVLAALMSVAHGEPVPSQLLLPSTLYSFYFCAVHHCGTGAVLVVPVGRDPSGAAAVPC